MHRRDEYAQMTNKEALKPATGIISGILYSLFLCAAVFFCGWAVYLLFTLPAWTEQPRIIQGYDYDIEKSE